MTSFHTSQTKCIKPRTTLVSNWGLNKCSCSEEKMILMQRSSCDLQNKAMKVWNKGTWKTLKIQSRDLGRFQNQLFSVVDYLNVFVVEKYCNHSFVFVGFFFFLKSFRCSTIMAAESSACTEMRNWKDTTLSPALQSVVSAPLFREEKLTEITECRRNNRQR